MEDLLHVVQVNHALDDGEQNLCLLIGLKSLLLLVQLVEERTILEVLSNEGVLIGSDAHAHVKHDIGVFQVTDDLELLHEVLFVPVLASLQVILDSDQLANVFAFVDLTEAAFTNQLQLLDVFFPYQEV